MITGTDILVVGGYGTVGRRIAARLAAIFPGRVAIAGRDLLAAREVERPGVWLPEQVVQHDAFFRGLSAYGWVPELDEGSGAS